MVTRVVSITCLVVVAVFGRIARTDIPPDEAKIVQPSEPDDNKSAKNPLARGWGDTIEWVELEQGIDIAKRERKPLMLIIHKTWCGACQNLKGKFGKAKIISELAKKFVMVNAEDDEEPWEEEYYPDGGKYIPRILFLSPDGEVLKDVVNPKDEYKQYPYYYSNPAPIIHVMQSVLQRYGPGGSGEKSKEGLEDKGEEKKLKEEKAVKDETKSEKEKDEKSEKEKDESKDEKGDEKKEEMKDKADLPRKEKKKSYRKEEDDDSPKPPSQIPPKEL